MAVTNFEGIYWVYNLLLRVDVSDDLDTLALLLEESGTSFNLVQFLGT